MGSSEWDFTEVATKALAKRRASVHQFARVFEVSIPLSAHLSPRIVAGLQGSTAGGSGLAMGLQFP